MRPQCPTNIVVAVDLHGRGHWKLVDVPVVPTVLALLISFVVALTRLVALDSECSAGACFTLAAKFPNNLIDAVQPSVDVAA